MWIQLKQSQRTREEFSKKVESPGGNKLTENCRSIFAKPKGEDFRSKEHFQDAQENQQSASLPNRTLHLYVHLTSQVNAPLK